MGHGIVQFVAIAAASLAGAAPAAEKSPDYLVQVTISDAGQVVATPRLTIAPDRLARFVVDGGKGPRYDIGLTATPVAPAQVRIDAVVDVTSSVGGRYAATPTMTTKLGEKATIMFGKDKPVPDLVGIEVILTEAASVTR